jgi:hypothetical protein
MIKNSHVLSYSNYLENTKKRIFESIDSLDDGDNKLNGLYDLIDYNFISDKESSAFLYRGISDIDSNVILIDSTNHIRLPKTGNGMYNSWIDGSPDWKEYPKRSKSIIMSTVYNTAYLFSGDTYRNKKNVYLTLPLRSNKNSEILYGICPKGDMWYSFEETLEREYGLPTDYSISSLFDDLGIYFQLLLDKSPRDVKYPTFQDLTNWIDELQSILDNPTIDEQETIDELLNMGNHHVDVINNILKDFGLLRSIHNIMNPNKNGFKLENLDYICKNLEGYESEIWFEGKAIGISIEYLETILNKKLLYMNIQDILNFAKK